MKALTKVLLAGAALPLLGFQAFAAPTITITAPTITITLDGTTGNGALDTAINDEFANLLTPGQPGYAAMQSAIDTLDIEANKQLSVYGDQQLLGQGFANANAYSAQAATLQGYEGYKLFSVMGGMLIGAQLPTMDPAAMAQIPDKIADEGDIYAGFAPSMAINFGFRPSVVIGMFNRDLGKTLDKFYVNLKFGSMNYEYEFEQEGTKNKASMATSNFGIGVNYQLLDVQKGFLGGFFKWRGVSLGSGFNYQSNEISFSTVLPEMSQSYATGDIDMGGGNNLSVDMNLAATPKVDLGVVMNTVSVPLEATTSVQLLWLLNMNLGVGCDLVFGSTDITAKAASDLSAKDIVVNVNGTPQPVTADVTSGQVALDAGTPDVAPSVARLRVMSGIGMQFGPLKIDMPVYYYFNSGLAFGVSAGIVW